MLTEINWFDREFPFDLPMEMFPYIVERLRGTPARLEERVQSLPSEILTRRDGEAWSIQENTGHLWDLEPLWAGRLDDLLAGEKRLRPADLQNRKTHEANHNANSIDTLLKSFRTEREDFVTRLDKLNEADVVWSALHPRLEQSMSVVDLIFFTAEHDNHHLTEISRLIRKFT